MVPYVNRTDEVGITSHEGSQTNTGNDCEDPCSHESFNSLLGRQGDELCPTKCDSAYVCEDIVSDDKCRG